VSRAMAAAIPTTNEFRPDDWACPSCGNHNFASKTACNKCHLGRVDGLPQAPGGGGATFRPGDWACPSCNNHNYADKTACNRCQFPKNGLAGGMGMGGYGRRKGFGKGGGMRGTPFSKDPVQGLGPMRPGDWICAQCGNHNYASRMACNKCFSPPAYMSNGYMMSGGGFGKGGKGGSMKHEGDWTCYACNNLNYASREACNKCQIPKTTFISKSGMRVGDWLCTACRNHNFKDKAWCNKCHVPKGSSTIYQGNLRDGDWICTRCANHNYADKIMCNGCQAPRSG